DPRPLRRYHLRPVHPLARRSGEPLRARDVRDGCGAPGARRPVLPVAAALPADAGGVRRHRAHVSRGIRARECLAGRLLSGSPGRAAARAAGAALYRYALAMARDDAAAAAHFEAEVRRLVPDVVAGAEQQTPVATLADARRTLAALEDAQARVKDRLDAVERQLEVLDRQP